MAGSQPAAAPEFQGKVAIVTGAASGIGRASAIALGRAGATVVLADRDLERGARVAGEIGSDGGRSLFLACDVARAADCEHVVRETLARFGRLDILFNNAGVIRRQTIVETSEEDWDLVMAVNVKAIYLMCRSAIPHMKPGSAIVNTASGWGLAGGGRAAAYCASKGAVVLLTKAMAIDCGALGIRVNCICPGDTDTAMLRDEARQLGERTEQFLAGAAARPLARVGTPEEIADAVLYLAGSRSSFVTGTALVVDGGGLAGSI